MNFKSYFVAVWQGIIGKAELQAAGDAGETDGHAIGLAYTRGVAKGLDDSLSTSLPMLLGIEQEELNDEIPGEVINVEIDLSGMNKKQLLRYADEEELSVDRRWSEDNIRIALEEYHN